jgi:hypothetical protein
LAWSAGEPEAPALNWAPPFSSNVGSGMSIPCSRMHLAKSSIACCTSASLEEPAAVVVVVASLLPPPSDATWALGDEPPPQAARSVRPTPRAPAAMSFRVMTPTMTN